MLECCATKPSVVDHLVIYRVDRLARKVIDHQMIRLTLEKLGISVRAVEESFDDSASGKLMENLMASMAQFDNDQRSARATDGIKQGLEHGRWVFRTPIGYVRPSERQNVPSLVPDPETAHLVRRSFEMYATAQFSKMDVLEEVTALGLSRKGKSLSPQSFSTLLANPIYAGRVVSQGFDFEGEGDFEPLVSMELFEQVQKVSRDVRSVTPKRHLDHPDFPLRRFVRCGACDTPLTGSWSKGRSKHYPYYRCRQSGCNAVSIRKEQLEQKFVDLLCTLDAEKDLFDLLAEVVRDVWKKRRSTAKSKNVGELRRLEQLATRKTRLLEAYLYDQSIDEDTYSSENQRLEDEAIAATSKLQPEPVSSKALDESLLFAESILEDIPGYWNQLETQLRPSFLRVVYPEGLAFGDDGFGTAETPVFFTRTGVTSSTTDGLVGLPGFEPGTSSLSGMRSNRAEL
jgi:site-specific DNA recombinase